MFSVRVPMLVGEVGLSTQVGGVHPMHLLRSSCAVEPLAQKNETSARMSVVNPQQWSPAKLPKPFCVKG